MLSGLSKVAAVQIDSGRTVGAKMTYGIEAHRSKVCGTGRDPELERYAAADKRAAEIIRNQKGAPARSTNTSPVPIGNERRCHSAFYLFGLN